MILLQKKILFGLIPIFLLSGYNVYSSDKSDNLSNRGEYEILNHKIETLGWGEGEKILLLAKKTLKISLKENDKMKIATSYEYLGIGNMYESNYNIAIKYFLKSLDILESENDNKVLRSKIADIYFYIGDVYYGLEYYSLSLQFFRKSLKKYNNSNEMANVAKVFNKMALNFFSLGENDSALIYFERLIALHKINADSSGFADVYNNRGLVLKNMGKYREALTNYKQAINIYQKLDKKKKLAVSFFNYGVIQGELHNNKVKIAYLDKSLTLWHRLHFPKGEVKVLIALAEHYIHGDFNDKKAKMFLDEAFKKAHKKDMKNFIFNIYNLYSELYVKTGDYKTAYKYKVLAEIKKDGLFNDNIQKITELRLKYEKEKFERENELMKKESVINKLNIKQQKKRQLMLIGVLLLIIALLLVIYNRYKLKSHSNKLLALQKKELETANATKDKFFSIIAHDLKNPMAVSNSLSAMLYDRFSELSNEQKHHIVKTLKNSASFTYELLEKLLNWALVESGRIQINAKILTLHKVIDTCVLMLENNAAQKNIIIKTAIIDHSTVFADENMILFIIRNLLSNAINFSPHNSTIVIRVESYVNNNFSEIIVEDNGIGIDKDDLLKLFRIDVDTATIGSSGENKGTGLGLILCKEFVEKNGGKIWAESKPGIGSKFSFTLPKFK